MKIVILGGGTAGWLAAYAIAKALHHAHEITVVESSQIGIIGAGEGTTGLFSEFLKGTWFPTDDIDIAEFVKETNATVKLGINHFNWKGDNTGYFAPIGLPPTAMRVPDTIFLHTLLLNKNKLHLAAPEGFFHEFGIRPEYGVFQFDAFKVGEYFKRICTKHPKTTYIDATISTVNLSEDGSISSLVTDSSETISGDFFIDCSGLRRVLMNKLNVGWHSYKKNLPVNAALPFQLPIEENYQQMTTAHALKNGWMWRIPTRERYGCGYVYDDTQITAEQAQQEVEETLGHSIDPIRNIKFESGRSEVLWKKNCLALGLAAAFAEPLEATSIHTTVAQLISFIFEYLQDTREMTVIESRIKNYNNLMSKLYDDTKDFLVLHYMGGRTDSEFWKSITNKETTTDRVEEMLEMCQKGMIPSAYTFGHGTLGIIGNVLHNWTLAGLDKIGPEHARNHLIKFNSLEQARLETDQYLTELYNAVKENLKMADK
jgi:tryptophan halogenase